MTSGTGKKRCFFCKDPIEEGKRYVVSWCIDIDAIGQDTSLGSDEDIPEDKLHYGGHYFHFPNCLPEVRKVDEEVL